LAETSVIQINDIDTLKLLSSNLKPRNPVTGSSFTSNFLECAIPNITELSVDLRLPLAAFHTFENGTRSAPYDPSLISGFTELPLIVARTTKLKRLYIWLDHDEPCSWSIVNERAILSSLESLSANVELEVSVNLPKLHPKWESPDRHFNEEGPACLLGIHRRFRQRVHTITRDDGSLHEKHEPDFPVLYELADWDETSTIEQVEESERRIWKEGDDPRQLFLDLGPSGHPW
jgi:hypothetical protein